MNNKRVEGSYVRVEDAVDAVQRLRDKGYARSNIYVVANEAVRSAIPSYSMEAEVSSQSELRENTGNENERSMWEKIKDAFTLDENETDPRTQPNYDADRDPLYAYRDDIAQGNIIVLVDEDASVTGGVHTNTAAEGYRDTVDDTIQLKEEKLDVEKNKVQTGEVTIEKRVVEETETKNVPVSHDEVIIERRPVTDQEQVETTEPLLANDGTEELVIPVTEEQLDVKKRTEVVEEVAIKKEKVTENKQVTDTVAKEEIDIERDGHVIEDTDQNG